MSRTDNIREKVLIGGSDANINFVDLCNLLRSLGFDERVKGSHHIFSRSGIEEIINVQPKGTKSKPYQVKQVRNMMLKYKLGSQNE